MSKTPKFLPVTERLTLVYYEIGVTGRKVHIPNINFDVASGKNDTEGEIIAESEQPHLQVVLNSNIKIINTNHDFIFNIAKIFKIKFKLILILT